MVKECPVIMNNDAVTVVRFDGNDIQFPSVGQEGAKTLNVKFENGKIFYCRSCRVKGRKRR